MGLARTSPLPRPAEAAAGAGRPSPACGVAGASWLPLKLVRAAAERGVTAAPLLLERQALLEPPGDGLLLGPAEGWLGPPADTAGWLEAAEGTLRRCSGRLGSAGAWSSDDTVLAAAPSAAAAGMPTPPAATAATSGACTGAAGGGAASGISAGSGGGFRTTT